MKGFLLVAALVCVASFMAGRGLAGRSGSVGSMQDGGEERGTASNAEKNGRLSALREGEERNGRYAAAKLPKIAGTFGITDQFLRNLERAKADAGFYPALLEAVVEQWGQSIIGDAMEEILMENWSGSDPVGLMKYVAGGDYERTMKETAEYFDVEIALEADRGGVVEFIRSLEIPLLIDEWAPAVVAVSLKKDTKEGLRIAHELGLSMNGIMNHESLHLYRKELDDMATAKGLVDFSAAQPAAEVGRRGNHVPEWIRNAARILPGDLTDLADLSREFPQIGKWNELLDGLTTLRAAENPGQAVDEISAVGNWRLRQRMVKRAASELRRAGSEEVVEIIEGFSDERMKSELAGGALATRIVLAAGQDRPSRESSLPLETAMELTPYISNVKDRFNAEQTHLSIWLAGNRSEEELEWARSTFPEHLFHDALKFTDLFPSPK